MDEKQWIVLNQALAAGEPVERSAHIARIAAMTQWARAEVETAANALLASALLTTTPHGLLELTDTGKAVASKRRVSRQFAPTRREVRRGRRGMR
ncbi:hypothetical protein AB0F44_19520 [Nocardioides sp. NPDC023903]|uniref:hypothetical protein n=1 Tax=Nocardioides sp. NPDC023903 TaxID=3157195 RepID=UPI0034074EEA